MAIAGIAWSD